MNIVIAMDSFKGSLSSNELALAVEKGIRKSYAEAMITKLPIADGGEGTVDALVEGSGGEFIEVEVSAPLLNKITAKYGILGDKKTAIIEMATASGLPLVPEGLRNPLKTSTYGTGELIKDALKRGCREFIVGIGGSATNDAGMGMLQALGYKFYDEENNLLKIGGRYIDKIANFDNSSIVDGLKESKFLIACDVDNPFYGLNGAAHVYSRQKGADDQMVLELDEKLNKFAQFVKDKLNIDLQDIKGSGAAGGLGGGFVSFLNAELKPGIDIVLDYISLEDKIKNADFVITGEGRIDFQSVMGKAPTGVSKLCSRYDIPCIALAGCVSDDAVAVHDYGIGAIFSTINYSISLADAMDKERATIFVEKAAEEIFRLIKICQNKYNK